MTRKKVTLAYITNDSERKASFKKRKKGLIKKVMELSTLCGVEACAIIYSPYEPEPEVWPSQMGAQAVLARFRRLSKIEQCRKMVNQESFTRQRIRKAEEQHRRLAKENKRRDVENFLFQYIAGVVTLDHFDLRDAAEMTWLINSLLREVNSRMETLKRNDKSVVIIGADDTGAGASSSSVPAYRMIPLPIPATPPPPPAPVIPVVVAPVVEPMVGPHVVDVPPLLALPAPDDNMDAALGDEKYLEGIPWSLMEGSTIGLGAGSSMYGGEEWDDPFMIAPSSFPYFFNPGDFGTVASDDDFGSGPRFGFGFGSGFGSGSFDPGQGSGSYDRGQGSGSGARDVNGNEG